MLRRLFTTLAALSLLMCLAAVGFWIASYWTPEPTSFVILLDGRREYGSRQGYVFLTNYNRFDPGVVSGSGSIVIPKMRRCFPGIEHEEWPATSSTIRVRYWLIVLATALLPLACVRQIVSIVQRSRRARRGLCAVCGYDIRATPQRCPECGTPSSSGAPPAVG
jgi:hypothetical protein